MNGKNNNKGRHGLTRRENAKSYSHLTDDYFQRSLAIDLDTSGADLTGAVEAHGVPVIWRRSAVCPNIKSQRGGPPRHHFNCPVCDGRRYIYWDEEELLVTFQNLNHEQSYYVAGRFVSGTVRITFPSGKLPNFWDLIIPKKEVSLYSEVVYVPIKDPTVYRLRYKPIQLESAYCVTNRANWPLDTYPPGRPDQQEVLYRFSKDDFTVLPTGDVKFHSKLPPTQAVTFVYWHQPNFLIMDLERLSRFSTDLSGGEIEKELEGYPITVIARLDYFVYDDWDSKENEDHYRYDDGEKLIER